MIMEIIINILLLYYMMDAQKRNWFEAWISALNCNKVILPIDNLI